MRVGLILGGGGVVGAAWEIGVLAGLARHAGFTATAATVIAGTSAGAIVGTRVALGHDIDDLVAEQRAPLRVAPPTGRRASRGPGLSVVPEQIMEIITSTDGTHEERGAAVGELAMRAHAVVEERAFVDSVEVLTGGADWPDRDLRITAVDCRSGSTVLWSRTDAIELARAVASSCAVPGWFPTVTHEGRHYTDAPRGDFVTGLATGADLDALVFIGPYVAHDPGMGAFPELRDLADAGLRIVEIRGGERFPEIADDLMDPTRRDRAVDIGLEDGAAHAAAVRALATETLRHPTFPGRPAASSGP